jgi:hypothetical protein
VHWDTLRRTFFLRLVGSVGHVVHCGASRVRNIDALFFLLRWDQYEFQKKCIGTRYPKLMFLRLVGYAGHVVHSGVRNIDTPFFMLMWY